MKILKKENLSRIGFVNKTIGFKGKLSCITDIARPENLIKSKFLFIILEGLPVPYAVEEIEINGDNFSVKFEDINAEEQAKKLLRKEIYADKISGKKKNDLLSWKNLVDYTAIDNNHGEIGKISEVLEYPMQMIAKCLVNEKEILFPLNEDIVLDIDEQEKKVFIELPDGLLDIYLK